jgi:hypothetical protein
MSEKAKPSPEITPGNELKLGGLTIGGGIVGEQRNSILAKRSPFSPAGPWVNWNSIIMTWRPS